MGAHAQNLDKMPRTRAGMLFDSIKNLMTGLGTTSDKNTAALYGLNELDRGQLELAYRGDWVAKKTVVIPAVDSFREWRSWQITGKEITKIEELEKEHSLQQKLMQVSIKDRLYGGAALVLGVGTAPPAEPIDVTNIKKGSLRYVHVVPRWDLTAGDIETSIESKNFGNPRFFNVQSKGGVPVRVDATRVIRFIECEHPDPTQVPDRWGDSVLQALDEAVKHTGLCAGGIATLVAEAKNDVLSIPNFMDNVASDEYRNKLLTRVGLVAASKSSQNMMIIDKEELLTRIAQTFTGLPDIYKLYLLVACGAADIPATRFLSQSAVGLGATGEGDARNYNDRLMSGLNVRVSPLITPLDRILVQSALGTSDPEDIWYKWNPLWQLSDLEKSTIMTAKAGVFEKDNASGIIPPEILQEARINQLVEDGVYPGLDKLWEDYVPPEDEDLNEDDPEVDDQFAKSKKAANENEETEQDRAVGDAQSREDNEQFGEQRSRAKDSRLQTLYLRRDLKNTSALQSWATVAGLELIDDMHVTIAYSRTPLDWIKVGEPLGSYDGKADLTVAAGGPRYLDVLGPDGDKVLVLMFASWQLCSRHGDVERAGGTHDYPDYQPHVTLCKLSDVGGTGDWKSLPPYEGELVFGPEIFEPTKAE
jgi:phage-related protein (TIGR01555 family)